MAALVVFNNVLDNVLGFDAGLRAAVNAQGVDDLESLGSLKDKEIDTIADNIRRGVRPDANGAGGAPGFNINCIQTRQLKKAAYAERHLRHRMSQPWTAANQVNTPLLNELWQFRDYIEAYVRRRPGQVLLGHGFRTICKGSCSYGRVMVD